jgi:hypothetical protein
MRLKVVYINLNQSGCVYAMQRLDWMINMYTAINFGPFRDKEQQIFVKITLILDFISSVLIYNMIIKPIFNEQIIKRGAYI